MDLNPIILSIPIFFLLIGLEVGYGFVKNRKLYRLNDALTNISCGIVEQLTGVFAKVFTVAAYHFIYTHFAIFELADTWYWIVLAFIGTDFMYYWAHRKSHEVNLFWLGHVVHHQSEDYNLSVALRQSTFQKMFTFYFYFPLAFIGFKTEWFLLASAVNLLYQFWIHTEVIGKMPAWYSYIFNTPSHHRVHHGRNPEYIDKNHAGSLIIWDRMFGTFTAEKEKPTYGITTPVNTWNPVTANLRPFAELYRELKRIPGFWNKVRFTFAPPGWYPKELGGYKPAPPLEKDAYRKYHVSLSPALNVYLLVQYGVVLGFTALFLFNLDTFSIGMKMAITLIMVLSVASIGSLFENRERGIRLEILRFVLSCAVVLFLYGSGIAAAWMPLFLLSFAAVSLAALHRIRFHQIARA